MLIDSDVSKLNGKTIKAVFVSQSKKPDCKEYNPLRSGFFITKET